MILDTEAAAVFDTLTRKGVREGIGRWATTFRRAQFIPAVEYLRANRIRTLVMREMEEVMSDIDAYVGGDDLTLTNLTGHPTVVVPDGNRRNSPNEQPGTITFTGKLFGESELLALAHAYQQASARAPPPPAAGEAARRETETRAVTRSLVGLRQLLPAAKGCEYVGMSARADVQEKEIGIPHRPKLRC